jgi:putative FmdB family regulatory protein
MEIMPLYEYQCRDCGHRFEVLQRMGEGSERVSCPECGQSQVDKQFSTFASASSGAIQASGGSAIGAGCGSGSGFR